MCTRFSFVASPQKMKRQFNLIVKHELQKSYNIGATQNAYILTNKSLELQIFRWGLIPHWANDERVGENLINATAEGISSKLSFRLPIRQRRCIIFADSFYMWRKEGAIKIPHRIVFENGDLMAFAGVWDVWVSSDQRIFKTFSIITVPSNTFLEPFEMRMPAILPTGTEQARWLSEISLSSALTLLKTSPNEGIASYPISEDINDLNNNNPSLHKPIESIS